MEDNQEQFEKWLDDPENDEEKTKLSDARDEAVLQFASSLLKRTLSETFVGVPMTDGSVSSMGRFYNVIDLPKAKRMVEIMVS